MAQQYAWAVGLTAAVCGSSTTLNSDDAKQGSEAETPKKEEDSIPTAPPVRDAPGIVPPFVT